MRKQKEPQITCSAGKYLLSNYYVHEDVTGCKEHSEGQSRRGSLHPGASQPGLGRVIMRTISNSVLGYIAKDDSEKISQTLDLGCGERSWKVRLRVKLRWRMSRR